VTNEPSFSAGYYGIPARWALIAQFGELPFFDIGEYLSAGRAEAG
jgi:hypothetical protein